MRLVSVILLCLTVTASAQSFEYERLSEWYPLPSGRSEDVLVEDGVAYLSIYEGGVRLYDISDPTNLVLISLMARELSNPTIVVSNGLAYVGGTIGGVEIYAITNPADPILVGEYKGWSVQVSDVAVESGYLYLATLNQGVVVLDVSNPTSPSKAGSYSMGPANAIKLADSHAYVVENRSSLLVFDASDPTNLVHSATYSNSYLMYDVAVRGDYAYLAGSPVDIVDVSTKTNPVLAGREVAVPAGSAIALDGNYAYMAGYDGSVLALDISDPSSPTNVGYFGYGYAKLIEHNITAPVNRALGVDTAGGEAYVAYSIGGLVVLDIATPSNLFLKSERAVDGYPLDIDVEHTHAYIAHGNEGLAVVDVSDARDPQLDVLCQEARPARVVRARGDHAFVAADAAGLAVVSVSNPALSHVVTWWTNRPVYDLEILDRYAYLNCGTGDLCILDLENPLEPVEVSSTTISGHITELALSQNRVYLIGYDPGVTDSWRVVIIDVANPLSPVIKGTHSGSVPVDVAGYGKYVCLADDYPAGFTILDAQDPDSPFVVGNSPGGGDGNRIVVADGYAFVLSWGHRLQTFVIVDPSTPQYVGEVSVPGTKGLAVAGSLLYAVGENGLRIVGVGVNEGLDPDNPTAAVKGDYNGDGVADVTVYEPATGTWYVRPLGSGLPMAMIWGFAGVVPVPGDYDGDGQWDFAVYDTVTGNWFIRTAYDEPPICFGFNWGFSGAIPVSGDYNGDGVFDLAVYDQTTGNWYIRSLGPGDPICFGQNWGNGLCVPVPGDFNGDSVWDLALYETGTGNWYIRSLGPIGPANPPITFGQNWGNAATDPVSGDYNGDGLNDLAVYTRNTGDWYIRSLGPVGPANPSITFGQNWGNAYTDPVSGDYNGDGLSDLSVYQRVGGYWYIRSLGSLAAPPITFGEDWGW